MLPRCTSLLGFTASGLALWLEGGSSLVECFQFHTIKHEALEAVLLREPEPCRHGYWAQGAHDVRLCLEFSNAWETPVWTLFSPRGAADGVSCARRGRDVGSEGSSLSRRSGDLEGGASDPSDEETIALAPGGSIICTGFASETDESAVLLSFATAAAAERLRPNDSLPDELLCKGWMTTSALDLPDVTDGWLCFPALQAMLLPRRASGVSGALVASLVVLGQHKLRLDEAACELARERGEIEFEVVQATHLRLDGRAAELAIESPCRLECDEGVQVPSNSNPYHWMGFDWSERQRGKADMNADLMDGELASEWPDCPNSFEDDNDSIGGSGRLVFKPSESGPLGSDQTPGQGQHPPAVKLTVLRRTKLVVPIDDM